MKLMRINVRRMFLLIYVLTVSSCVQQLSSNLQQSNELMTENIEKMTESKAAIEENTHQIKRSTDTMLEFQFIFPIIFGVILLVLGFILFRFSRKLSKFFKDVHK